MGRDELRVGDWRAEVYKAAHGWCIAIHLGGRDRLRLTASSRADARAAGERLICGWPAVVAG